MIAQIIDFIRRRFFTPETFCGLGSYIRNTKEASLFIEDIIKQGNIKSIVDIGCGDLNWLQYITLQSLGVTTYTGIDFDDDMLALAKVNCNSAISNFIEADVRELNRIGKYDLIICRDLFLHLSNSEILKLLKVFKDSGSKYLLTNNYIIDKNIDLSNNVYTKRSRKSRKINLYLEPYCLPKFGWVMKELKCGSDRYLSLWELDKLNE